MARKYKQKTKKALAKRLKLTKSGKVKRHKAGRGHLMSKKSGKRVRHLRKPGIVQGKIAVTYAKLLAPGS
jgi:large subunit ribosomal protein L35